MKLYPFLILLFCSITSVAQYSPEYVSLTSEANQLYNTGNYRAAAEKFSQAFALNKGKAKITDRYNAACNWSLIGQSDSAFVQLEAMAATGSGIYYEHMKTDADLTSLHNDNRWERVLGRMKNNKDAEDSKLDKSLVAILDTINKMDQKYRSQLSRPVGAVDPKSEEGKQIIAQMIKTDSINLLKVSRILDQYGWPGPDLVGQVGAVTIFLVIQHSPVDVQLKYLPMMRKAVQEKKASGSNLAMLEDRVNIFTGKKQVYGTQVGNDEKGVRVVLPLDDPDNVDARRATVGLPALADYLHQFGMEWDVKAYKEMLPRLEQQFFKNSHH